MTPLPRSDTGIGTKINYCMHVCLFVYNFECIYSEFRARAETRSIKIMIVESPPPTPPRLASPTTTTTPTPTPTGKETQDNMADIGTAQRTPNSRWRRVIVVVTTAVLALSFGLTVTSTAVVFTTRVGPVQSETITGTETETATTLSVSGDVGPDEGIESKTKEGSFEFGATTQYSPTAWTTTGIRKYATYTSSAPSNNYSGSSKPHFEEENIGNASSNTSRNNNKKKNILNIHVVPHTHDDVGWLKTVDEYYNGWNNTIQLVSVREILTSVVEALEENPSRTFTYVEQKFFTMWWKEQPDSVKERVKRLVRDTKQLTFVNGGWCMHDEAATHYIGMIDQTTLGHAFLKETFDYVPTVGWQLDPFGHSSTQSSLMTYKMGFDALYFGRIDYQDMELRHATKECEGLWNAFGSSTSSSSSSTSQGENKSLDEGSIFWGLTGSYMGNYGSPGGYCLDVNCGPGQKSFIDKNRKTLIAMVQDFLLSVRQQSDRTKGDHVMLTMGSDFQYQRASVNFANLDLLIGTIMNLQEDETLNIPMLFGPNYDDINIFYSSPEYYTACKYNETVRHRTRTTTDTRINNNANHTTTSANGWNRSETSSFLRKTGTEIDRQLSGSSNKRKSAESSSSSPVEWSIKKDDFFPYSDCPNCFWTGYFTSRPALKRFERVASSFLLAARQVESTPYHQESNVNGRGDANLKNESLLCEDPMALLEDAVGVLQHHDGVSGTSKQHVAYDYAKTVQAGIDAVVPCTIRKLKHLLLGDEDGASEKYLKDLTYCQLLNETKCGISVDATATVTATTQTGEDEGGNSKDLYVIVYNGLASNRSATIDLPIGSNGDYIVEDLQEGSVETMGALRMPLRSSNHRADGDSFVLSFMAPSLPAVGAKVFRIRKHDGSITSMLNEIRVDSLSTQMKNEQEEREDGTVKISNDHFSVLVDTKTGDIRRLGTNEVGKLSSWGYYTSFDSEKDAIHEDDDHNAGAYIFRPSTPYQELKIVPTKNATIVHTSIGTDIHTTFEEPWIQTTTRIRKGIPYVEIEYQIGPVPISDGRGKEVVTRYNTSVNNDAIFYTDSNGREFMKRQRNHRPTWDLTVFEPVAGNYYPINTAIYVDENEKTENGSDLQKTGPSFAVLTDRTQGGGSILDGTIELMVHRRILADDYRGVDEPLNETDVGITPCAPYGDSTRIGEGLVIRGKHRILVEKTECQSKPECGAVGGAQLARSVMDSSFAEPLVFVASTPSSEITPFRTLGFSALKEPLPENVMLITKRLLYKEEATSYLIRLGHQYGESVDVDLSILFPLQAIEEIRETTLSGNRDIHDWRNERFDWIPSETRTIEGDESFKQAGAHTITLAEMDIRTIIVKVKSI